MNSCEIMNHNWVSVAFNGDLMHFEIFYTHTHTMQSNWIIFMP